MADPQYKPGDVVNGHRLTVQDDGSMAWLPMAPEPRPTADSPSPSPPRPEPGRAESSPQPGPAKKSRRGLWITVGSIGAALLLIIVIGSLNREAGTVNDAGTEAPAATEEVVAEPDPEPVTVPAILVGMIAADAADALRGMGLEPLYDGEPDATVLEVSPAAGTAVEEGSVVTLTVEQKPVLSMGQQQAVAKGQQYLGMMGFSRTGLVEQLEFEGFSAEDANFAADFINPDWNAEATEKAKSYLDMMAFSRQGLIDQLTYEGFTPEQAEHGVASNGY